MMQEEAEMSKQKKAIVWGDSVARGVIYDAARDRYRLSPCPAAELIAQARGMEITNRSRMGMTSAQGVAMVERDLSSGMRADYAILEFGGNDCDFDWQAVSASPDDVHLPRTVAELYRDNLCRMISDVRAAGMKPVLVNLPPIDGEHYLRFITRKGLSEKNILKWLGSPQRIYRFQERYSMIVSRVARECKCRLFDIRSAFLDVWDSVSLLCSDGIHPTEEGQRLIGQAILTGC